MILKKVAIGLTCLSMMLSNTLPANAENNIDVAHAHVYIGTGNFFTALTGSYNEGTHTVAIMAERKCSCGSYSSLEVRREERAHSFSFSSITNHTSPGMHHYRGTCACGFSTTVMLDCPGGNNHVSP